MHIEAEDWRGVALALWFIASILIGNGVMVYWLIRGIAYLLRPSDRYDWTR